MDPVTIGGAVVGVFSLGIQITKWATTYVDSLQCQQLDVASARNQLQSMTTVLQLIQATTPKVFRHFEKRLADDAEHQVVRTCIQNCNREIQALQALLVELTGNDKREYGVRSLRRNLRDQRRRLTYPYQRDKLIKLEESVGRVNNALQTALTTINLRLGSDMAGSLHDQNAILSKIEHLLLNPRQPTNTPLPTHQLRAQAHTEPKRSAEEGLTNDWESIWSENGPKYDQNVEQLVSKPSLLKETCDAVGWENPPVTPDYKIMVPAWKIPCCTCIRRRKIERSTTIWGFLSFQTKKQESEAHRPDCPVADIIPTHLSRRVETTYTAALIALHHAISLSISLTSGAGGSSISPSLRTLPVVDGATSPAFQLLKQLSLGPTGLNITASEVRESVLEDLCQLFKSGKASPFDVSAGGETLIDVLPFFRIDESTPYLFSLPEGELTGSLDLISKMHDWGVPSDIKSNVKRNPLSYVVGATLNGRLIPAMIRITELLYSLNYPLDLPVIQGRRLIVTGSFLSLISRCPRFSEDIWTGPISHAVASCSKPHILEILRSSRNCLAEKNVYGHTPFHLATHFPEGLELILKAAQEQNSLGDINAEDLAGLTPLRHAILASDKDHLQIFELEDCLQNRCPRARSISLLLTARCSCGAEDLALLSDMIPCCGAVPSVLIDSLKDRRERLKTIGLKFLNEDDQTRLGLHDSSVLDGHTEEVIRRLEQASIAVVDDLRTYSPRGLKSGTFNRVSLYHIIRRKWLAQQLFAAGFGDTNLPDSEGLTPVAEIMEQGIIDNEDAEYLMWLFSHGARLESPTMRPSTLARKLAFVLGRLEQRGESIPGELLNLVLEDSTPDECKCACYDTGSGCTPLTNFLGGMWSEMDSDTAIHPKSRTVKVARKISEAITTKVGGEFVDIAALCLRSHLFFLLGLRHTCCSAKDRMYSSESAVEVDEDDLEEIRDEDGQGIQELDRVVHRFQQECAVDQHPGDGETGIAWRIDWYIEKTTEAFYAR